MISALRKYAYLLSVLAVACFFLFPEPNLAVIIALLLQTLAYIIVAGRSKADAFILTGITVLLLGLLPDDHPLIRGPFYGEIRPWLVGAGACICIFGLVLVARRYRQK